MSIRRDMDEYAEALGHKEKEKVEKNSSGIGFLGLLTLVFIFLKLWPGTVVNDWSWWWVLAPLWGPFALALIIFLVVLISIKVANWGQK